MEESQPLQPPQETQTNDTGRYDRFIIGLQVFVVVVVSIGVLLAFIAPSLFLVFINVIWLLIFGIVVMFILLGVLIMVGLKNEVKQVMSFFIEGTLSIVDLMDFLKKVVVFLAESLKIFVGYLVPILAYALALAIYLGIIYLYKWVGRTQDVLVITIVLTVVMMVFTAFLNKKGAPGEANATSILWAKRMQMRFKDAFGDGVEVALFIFFMTMDSTALFFLPKELNVPLHASFGNVDLMVKGWQITHDMQFTFTIIMAAIGVEILRFLIRIIAGGYEFVRNINKYFGPEHPRMRTVDQVKWAIRQSFHANIGDAVKFVTYTTFLVLVFLFFPKLKLLAMATGSITGLALDFLIKGRLEIRRGTDLFSKIVSTLFKV